MVGRSGVNGLVTDPVTLAYHELRSPLALVATMARSAAAECPDEFIRDRCLGIVRAAERMLRTARYLMAVADTSRSEGSSLFDPGELVRVVVRDYQVLGVPIILRESMGLTAKIVGSPEHLEALLCSLMGNALDHGDECEPIILSIATSSTAFDIRIENGIAERNHPGLGLGSYIGDKLARSLSASLTIDRMPDRFIAHLSIPVHAQALLFAV